MNRIDVWHAMSNLYLDNETDNVDLLLVAEKLSKTDLSIEELDHIFYREVHPVLCWNFTTPAGIWGYFDKEYLNELIADYLDRRKTMNWFRRWQEKLRQREINRLKKLVTVDWEKTKLLVEFIRDNRIIHQPGS